MYGKVARESLASDISHLNKVKRVTNEQPTLGSNSHLILSAREDGIHS